MKNKCVAIRVDSSTAIGSGHLMRCLTLAERMRKEKSAEVYFISRDLGGNLHEKIKAAGFSLYVLPRHSLDKGLTGYAAWLTVSPDVDAAETKTVLREIGKVDRLVVDSYALDITWEREMRPFADEIFVIDDLANRAHDCDILLDQNFSLDKETRYLGLVPKSCKLLLGPRHALLREEFHEAKKRLRKRDGILRNILVFYGGSDLTNETMKALHALCSFHETQPEITVEVIVGASNPHRQAVEAFCESSDIKAWIRYHVQVDNIAAYMARADLMLGAGDSTTWERCFLELPAIVTTVAENQEKIAEDCAKAGYITYLGWSAEVAEADIASALRAATEGHLAAQRARMREMFTGSEMERLCLRKATEADAETLFQWRNDSETRANSFHTEPIPYEEHVAWLKTTLRDPAQAIYILCEDGVPIGQVRLSTKNGVGTISYSIAPACRARGYGRAILRLAENLCVERGEPHVLRGYVKKKNVASQMIFEALGYIGREASDMNCLVYTKSVSSNKKPADGAGGETYLSP